MSSVPPRASGAPGDPRPDAVVTGVPGVPSPASYAAADASVDAAVAPAEPEGVSVERLSDYLDAGRQPWDSAIEEDPAALAQLAALERLRSMSVELVATDEAETPAPDPSWIAGVMSRVRLEARTGREIPLSSPDERSRLHITEGAVRSLIREAGDSVTGAVVVSCGITGDVTLLDSPVRVDVAISALFGAAVPALAESVRNAVSRRLLQQTELVVEAVDVTVRDVHLAESEGSL